MNDTLNTCVANNVNSAEICRIKRRKYNNCTETNHNENITNEHFSDVCEENDVCSENENNDLNITEQSVVCNVNFDINLPNERMENHFLHGLRQWAITYNIPHNSLSKLLSLLKTLPVHANLPNNPKTVLRTPRKICLQNIEPGVYTHFGLQFAIEKLISKVDITTLLSIELLINVDGLPLSKSSNSQLYPILCSLFKYPNNISVIGIYHGYEKPASANDFLTDFVKETVELVNNGFIFEGRVLPFKIKGFICDAPAKSYISYCKGHAGFYSCTKCTQKGKYIKGRVSFLKNNSAKRTDDSFCNKLQPEHHNGISILENISNFGMITNFPLEYMYLICLGVVRKLLNIWLHGKPSLKLSNESITKISDLLFSIRSYVPNEFVRKTRSLNEVKHWKATEFRFF